jgi:hypothetical protein
MKIIPIIVLAFYLAVSGALQAADESPANENELVRLREENRQIIQENQRLKNELARAGMRRNLPAKRSSVPSAQSRAAGVRIRPHRELVEARTEPLPDRPIKSRSERESEPVSTPPPRHSVSVLQENVAAKDVKRVQQSPENTAPSASAHGWTARDASPLVPAPDIATPKGLPESDARGFLFSDSALSSVEASPSISLRDLATTPPVLRSVQTVFARAYLRKGIFTENGIGGISDPAEITYVHPGEGKDSFAIDAGLGAFWDTRQVGTFDIEWGPAVEYHRNTSASDRKNLLELGLLYAGTIGDPTKTGNEMQFVRLQGSTLFKNNNVEDFHAIATNLDIFPVFGPAYIDEWIVIKAGPIPFRWQPFAGLSYERTTATMAGLEGGGRFLIRCGVELEVFPIHFLMGESVGLTAGFTTRWAPASSGIYESDSGWNGYFHTDLTYWFRDDAVAINHRLVNFGFGLTYVKGDNPELGLHDQDLLTLSFKTKY